MADERDEVVEKVLKGLREVAPPEGMQARIAQRLEQCSARQETVGGGGLGWHGLAARFVPAAAWWRGAVSGAAVAALAMGAVLLVQHDVRGRTRQEQRASSDGEAKSGSGMTVAVQARPCPSPAGVLRAGREMAVPSSEMVRVATVSRPQPLADAPLTAEERGLVRLVQVANPRDLTMLNPEAEAELQAKEAAEFESFFPTPPPAKDVDDGEANQPPGS